MAHVQEGDYFCLRYLLSDESWRIAITQKTMEMAFCIAFCATALRFRYSALTNFCDNYGFFPPMDFFTAE
jgi:hypothetical protein